MAYSDDDGASYAGEEVEGWDKGSVKSASAKSGKSGDACSIRQHMSAYVSICQNTSAYVSIRQVSLVRHTSAYVSKSASAKSDKSGEA